MKELLKDSNFFTTVLTKPIRYTILAVPIISIIGMLLTPVIFSEDLLYIKGLVDYISSHSGIIFIIFFVSISLFIVQLIPDLYKQFRKIRNRRFLKKIQNELYENEDSRYFLLKIYNANGEPVVLNRNNQKVLLLEKHALIFRASREGISSIRDYGNVYFPYILHQATEDRLDKELKK